jgi:hypothetical protein
MKAPLRIALFQTHLFDDDYPYSIAGIKKLRQFGYDPMKKEYTGCLTPIQILELVKLGVEITHNHDQNVEWFKKQKAEGNMYRTWVYFWPSDEYIKLKERVENESH